MPKRKKRGVITKKRKDDDGDNDEFDEPVAKKVAVPSSTSFLEDETSQTSSFNVEAVNIGRSDTMGGEVGFSSHFWCNYCEYSSDTKKELVTHMREHMTKCSYCNFSSLSKAEIAKHVKCEHADETDKAICEVDSSSSGTEHDLDKDPCSACIFCDFMTYSTEHLEKHTSSKHQGMLPKSVAKMISKQASARIRKDDALFYCAISSDDRSSAEGENFLIPKSSDCNEKASSILIEVESDVKPNISRKSPESQKDDVKPNPHTLSQVESKDSCMSGQTSGAANTDDWRVKVETLYCLSCPYSNVAIEKLKCHALTQHPDGVAAASFTSEATYRLQDITFYCARESCSYSNVQCSDYQDHLMKCCTTLESLLFGEKERLKDTIKFIFKCQEKQGATPSTKEFLKFSSQYVSYHHPHSTPSPPVNPSTPQNERQSESRSAYNNHYPKSGNSLKNSSGQNNGNLVPNSTHVTQTANRDNFNSNPTGSQCQATNRQGFSDSQNTTNCSSLNPSAGVPNSQTSNVTGFQQGQAMALHSDLLNHAQQQQGLNSNHVNSGYQENSNSANNSSYNLQNSNSFNNSCFQQHSSHGVQNNNQPSNPTNYQEPVNVNTNTGPVEQHNMYDYYAPQPVPNSESIVAPSFNSQLPILGQQTNSDSSCTPYQSINDTLTTVSDNQSAQMSSSSLNVLPPKTLDILPDANAILLDTDLGMQSWPATQTHNSLPPQNVDKSQSSLHTPPLPQDNDNNPPVFSGNTNIANASQTSASNFPESNASNKPPLSSQFPYDNANTSTPHAIQSQPPHQPLSEPVIDLDNPQSYAAPESSPHLPLQNPTPMNFDSSTENSSSASAVPNFLVPSSSTSEYAANNSQQSDSFLTGSVQSHAQGDQTLSMGYPSTPPSQKNVPMGASRFPVSNSPLSPSIYLSAGGTDNSQMQPVGSSPMGSQFGPPPPLQGINQPNSTVRQRLFPSQGEPRGPRMQQRMVRPPVNPADDDVIVTAVVRGPAPQRPPLNHRGRGMGAGGRGMAPNQRGMAPVGRGIAPSGRGMLPGGRGMAPIGRGMAPRGRGMAPGVRGLLPGRRGTGMAPNGRGRGGMPLQRGRGGMHRGRGGGIPPPSMSPQGKQPADVSGHFVDFAREASAGEEGDEIQIVGVTPGKGGAQQPPPRAVDAKKFSYCCIHCGQDQGSKEVMKRHINSSHSESLLGAFRNVESGQWLLFCPQMMCEFMTYEESRLVNHLFACFNLNKSKPLPYDMQSALRNLKSLRMRHAETQQQGGRGGRAPGNMDGQGMRDAFNNNLKDAFDDMVENKMGRQMMRPPNPSQAPTQRQPLPNRQQPLTPFTNQRGALRGPYSPRGTPPKNVRQGFPGPGQMSPGYHPRNPMVGGSPRQPRYPGSPGQLRGPGPQFRGRGMPSPRGGPIPPVRGQRPLNPRGGLTPRPNIPGPGIGMPGNEQTPIIIDLDADSPEKAPDNNSEIHEPTTPAAASVVADVNPSPMSVDTPSVNTVEQMTTTTTMTTSTSAFDQSGIANPVSTNVLINTTDSQLMLPEPMSETDSASTSTDANLPLAMDQNDTKSTSHHSSEISSVVDNIPSGVNAAGPTTFDNSQSQANINDTKPRSSPCLAADNAQTSSIQDNLSSSATTSSSSSARNIPSPSQLLAEMNSVATRKVPSPQPTSETPTNQTQQPPQSSPSEQNPQDSTSDNSSLPANDEELVNTILLDKVFAKVPHMPKKLSQRLVLKFKKYAADRGMIITPTSRVIDEFVSKISYKGSHSAPTPIGQDNKNSSESNRPQPLPSETKPVVGDKTEGSSDQGSTKSGAEYSTITRETPSSEVPPSCPDPSTIPPCSLSNSGTYNSETSDSSPVVTKSDDVIETKVIFAERKLQFKGAFANIVKEKNANSTTPLLPMQMEDSNSENSGKEMPPNSSQSQSSPPDVESEDNASEASNGGNNHINESNIITKNLKKEIIEPVHFPSVPEENSIEVKSSVDHIVCGYAGLEVDIAGKPLSADAFTDKEEKLMEGNENAGALSPVSKDLSEKNREKTLVDSSSGTLNFKIRKGIKPRVAFHARTEDEIVQEKSGDSNSSSNSNDGFASAEDQLVRRSERKRKAVKLDYDPEELDDMDEFVSDEDDEYHMESDDSYDGSDSDGRGKKKAKKSKVPVPQDPSAFDIATRGCYGCWKCNKVFSRVTFLKRHIIKKHKEEGLCAIIFTETGIPSEDQPSVLLFCPQICKYVTSDHDAYPSHLGSCTKPPLNVADLDYKNIQETFFNNLLDPLCESIVSGVISTKIPVKSTTAPKKKTSTSTHPPGPPELKSSEASAAPETGTGNSSGSSSQHQDQPPASSSSISPSFVTTATIHHPPPRPMQLPSPHSLPHQDDTYKYQMPEDSYQDPYYDGDMDMLPGEDDPVDMYYPEEQY